MNILRNQFLGTTSLLLDPREPAAGDATPGKDTTLNKDVGAEDDAGGADDTGADDTGGADDAGDDDTGDDAGDAGDGADDDGDDDPDLADLAPEVRAKVKDVIQKRVAKETTWRDKQIDRLHAKRRAAEEDVTAAAAIVGRQPGAQQDDPNRKYTAAEVKAEAAALSAKDRYDADCDTAFTKGSDVYGAKWQGALAKLPKLGGIDATDMVDILATEKPHVVLFALADPEVYERVMALPPARRRTELVKLSLKPEPKAKQTVQEEKRPGDMRPPPRTLQNGRRTAAQTVDLYDDKASDDAWYAARNETRRKKFSAAQ